MLGEGPGAFRLSVACGIPGEKAQLGVREAEPVYERGFLVSNLMSPTPPVLRARSARVSSSPLPAQRDSWESFQERPVRRQFPGKNS